MALATLTQCKTAIGNLDTSSTSEDTFLQQLLDTVSAMIARHLGYPPASAGATPTIEDTTYTHYSRTGELMVSEDGGTIYFPVRPVVSVTNVYDDVNLDWATAETSTDYILDGVVGRLIIKPAGTWGTATIGDNMAVKCTYVAGFETVPSEITNACTLWVKHLFENRRTQGQTSMSEGGISIGISQESIPPNVGRLLEPFKLHSLVML